MLDTGSEYVFFRHALGKLYGSEYGHDYDEMDMQTSEINVFVALRTATLQLRVQHKVHRLSRAMMDHIFKTLLLLCQCCDLIDSNLRHQAIGLSSWILC